jgi:hypothetical protein
MVLARCVAWNWLAEGKAFAPFLAINWHINICVSYLVRSLFQFILLTAGLKEDAPLLWKFCFDITAARRSVLRSRVCLNSFHIVVKCASRPSGPKGFGFFFLPFDPALKDFMPD